MQQLPRMASTEGPDPAAPTTDFRDAMSGDHEELVALFDELLAAFRSGDRDEATAMFARFEQRLENHLALEDDVFLPTLRRDYPTEASELAVDHHRIRARLLELGVDVDLHLARAAWVEDFVSMLRAHAAREDALLYRWASEHSPRTAINDALRRVGAADQPARPTPI